MAVKALYDYSFPSKDRPENFGEDMLVNIGWAGNDLFCSPACVRVPRAMTWAAFRAEIVDPWAGGDPDYDPTAVSGWRLDGEPLTPADEVTLADAGVGHKSLIMFRTDGS
jgi:phenol hydroxylase P4 protein